MGKWQLERVMSRHSELRRADRIGTNFYVTLHLAYTPSKIGSFQEPPKLEWNEQITMLEHHDGKWWNFSTNMYEHNPLSQTLLVWPRRYIAAYETAATGRASVRYGSCKLFDQQSRPVTIAQLGAGKASNKDKAEAVRSYLKSHGGKLVVEIQDTPAIIFRPNTHKERLLRFDCGLAGSALRAKGEQHLTVNQTGAGAPRVTARFSNAPQGAIPVTNLTKVVPPTMVSQKRAALFSAGEFA